MVQPWPPAVTVVVHQLRLLRFHFPPYGELSLVHLFHFSQKVTGFKARLPVKHCQGNLEQPWCLLLHTFLASFSLTFSIQHVSVLLAYFRLKILHPEVTPYVWDIKEPFMPQAMFSTHFCFYE